MMTTPGIWLFMASLDRFSPITTMPWLKFHHIPFQHTYGVAESVPQEDREHENVKKALRTL